ncbi:MAG: rhodanese-related sulfurtransferase [Firmicutes bacterium]|nr:rhodanese-related sulfurtransferase [Bacillota bacterium]
MTTHNPYLVLLYYQFVAIEDPIAFASEQRQLCQSLGLVGRIIVADEGINGTVAGPSAACEAYMDAMHDDFRFANMPFKIDGAATLPFKRLSVRVKEEIVAMRPPVPVSPANRSGERLSPQQFYTEIAHGDVVILDGRNDYEYDVGHFRGAIRPEVRYFRQFPEWLETQFPVDKDQRILTYCTGGIRCEKLTAYMIEQGYTNVAQLDGGIITYGQDDAVRGRGFDGKCYVFDERLVVPVNQQEEVIVGRCHHCGEPCDRFINCAYDPCHYQHLCCEKCDEAHAGCCSSICKALQAEFMQSAQ